MHADSRTTDSVFFRIVDRQQRFNYGFFFPTPKMKSLVPHINLNGGATWKLILLLSFWGKAHFGGQQSRLSVLSKACCYRAAAAAAATVCFRLPMHHLLNSTSLSRWCGFQQLLKIVMPLQFTSVSTLKKLWNLGCVWWGVLQNTSLIPKWGFNFTFDLPRRMWDHKSIFFPWPGFTTWNFFFSLSWKVCHQTCCQVYTYSSF